MNKDIHVQARAVIIKDNHILLCKTKGLEPNFYFLPGGHIEHGESARNTLLRELKEEIGFEFEIKRFLGCMEYSYDPNKMKYAKCHTHEYNFIFETSAKLLPSTNMRLQQIEKHIEISWMILSRLDQIDFRPELLKTQIAQWLDSKLNNAFQSEICDTDVYAS